MKTLSEIIDNITDSTVGVVVDAVADKIILLKEDLQISKNCHKILSQLLLYVRNNTYFSPLFTTHFDSSISIPYSISETDPSQIIALKKIINALDAAEKGFQQIENLNIETGRSSLELGTDVIQIVYNQVHQLYGVIKLINEANADIQSIIGPYISLLLPLLGHVSHQFSSIMPLNVCDATGKKLACGVNLLPTTISTQPETLDNLSKLVFTIPSYLATLQASLSKETLSAADKVKMTADEYQALMLKKAKETSERLNALMSCHYNVTALPNYCFLLMELGALSIQLVSNGAPFTKDLYKKAVETLNKIRHNIAPRLVMELEKYEDEAALYPNVLAGPVITTIESYYKNIASHVESLATAAGVIDEGLERPGVMTMLHFINQEIDLGEKIRPIAQLDVLRDDCFEASIHEQALIRLVQVEYQAKSNHKMHAARLFFKAIEKLDSHQDLYTASPGIKNKLKEHYKQFQDVVAGCYPKIDSLIVSQLNTAQYESSIVNKVGAAVFSNVPNSFSDSICVMAGFALTEILMQKMVDLFNSYLPNPAKQWYASTHCKDVLACKKGIYWAIEQSKKQNEFNAALIKDGIAKRAACLYKSRGNKTVLTWQREPFVPLHIQGEDILASSADDDAKRVAVDVQLKQLELAKKGLDDFRMHLRSLSMHVNPMISELSPEDKEILRGAYKKFQPQFISDESLIPEANALNQQIVQSLGSSQVNQSSLSLQDLAKITFTLNQSLDRFISQLKDHSSTYAKRSERAKKDECLSLELKLMGAAFMKKTLFAQISSLGLIDQIDNFINKNYMVFLKTNLDNEDYATLDSKKVPFVDFHEDSSDIILHKQVLNAFHYLTTGLHYINALATSEDPTEFTDRWLYLTKFINVALSIRGIRIALSNTFQHQGLAAVVKDGLKLLEPLEHILIFGASLQPCAPVTRVEVNPDIILAWKSQQEIVTRNRQAPLTGEVIISPPEVDITVIAAVNPEPLSNADYLPQMVEQLFKISKQINANVLDYEALPPDDRAHIDEMTQALIGKFSNLSYGPGSLKQLMSAFVEINTQLTTMGKVGRDRVYSQLSVLPTLFGQNILSIADTADFNLGFKKLGELSKSLTGLFKEFYSGLIKTLAFKKEQDSLKFIVGVGSALILERIIAEQARLDELNSRNSDTTRNELQRIYGVLGLFEELRKRTSTEEVQVDFLKAYQVIQPTLMLIDRSYDCHYFLRGLKKPRDFEVAIVKILGLKDKLKKVIVAEGLNRVKYIRRSEARIELLNQALDEERVIAEQQVIEFKNKVFFTYLQMNIKCQFETELGCYTDYFMANILRDLIDQRETILSTVNIDLESDIQALIEQAIDLKKNNILWDKALLRQGYSTLNHLRIRLTEALYQEALAIDKEQTDRINPIRAQKGIRLLQEMQRLSEVLFSADTNEFEIGQQQRLVDEVLMQMKDYNAMIKVYEHLSALRRYLNQKKEADLEAKIVEINFLLSLLEAAHDTPRQRLNNLTSRAMGNESKNILLKNADNMFIKILKFLWSFLTGWKDEKEVKVAMFSKIMIEINTEQTQPLAKSLEVGL